MKIYNSATHTKEEFVPHEPGKVSMYTCGPTVYHFAHIGNLRSYIMEDVLEKLLRYAGYDVTRVMNITDVGHLASDADTGEDKMLKGAQREHKTVMEIAQFYTDAFFADCKKLNIKYPDVVQPATGMIGDYIKVISSLIDRGYAYFAGGNVYFDTSKLEKYYVVHQVQVRGSGAQVGLPLGSGIPRLAHRVLLYLHEVSGGAPGHPLRRHRQRFPPPYQRDRPVGGVPGPPLVQILGAYPPPEHQLWQDEQVQGVVPHRLPAGGEGV